MASRGTGREGGPVPAPEPLPFPVVDAHCHLDLMDGDLTANLAEAASVGIDTVVSVGVDVASSQWQADIAGRYPSVWAAVALHPNEAGAGAASAAALMRIAELAALPQVCAVGESGLDYFRTEDAAGQAAQRDSFRAHIQIAKDTGKALMIHDREAHDDVLAVLADEGAPPVTVFHAFSGDEEFALRCAAAGYYMSFAGNVTFKNAPGLRAAAAAAPAGLLLVETDAPFLTPMPYRGRPNGPHLVPLTLRVIAAAREAELASLCARVRENAARAFSIELATS